MKLSRLLVLILTLLLAFVFLIVLAITVTNTRDYLVAQMRSHAQDTATSLGLSLTTSMQNSDTATMNSMVDALFDRGYYREIVIRSISGKVLVDRTQPPLPAEVPQWFSNLVVLEAPRGESLVMQGWKQLATVEVASHPGHAYRELWRVTRQAFWWIMGMAVGSLILVVLVLHAALKPLSEMEALALSICKRQFNTLKKIPWTRELRRVTDAMNIMSGTVERMLGEQTALAERMHAKAYQDGVTGLANGRSFRERLDHMLSSPEEFPGGALLIAHLGQFQEYNDKHGHAAGDTLLRRTATALLESCKPYEPPILARMNGAEFAILVPDVSPNQAEALGESLVTALASAVNADNTPAPVHIGIAMHRPNQHAGALLTAADMALHAAQDRGTNAWQLYREEEPYQQDSQWKSAVEFALKNGHIQLQYQPVRHCKDQHEIYREALVRLASADGSLQAAGTFVSIAKQLGLTAHLDKLVTQQALERLAQDQSGSRIAVNLFATSLLNNEFMAWLHATLSQDPTKTSRLVFETHELGLTAHFNSLWPAIQRIRATGAQFAIDRFGHNAAIIGRLRDMRIDYIKLDGSYSRQIHLNESNQFFVQTMLGIAHGVGIQVIAEYVETTEEMDALQGLGVDGMQGYFIGIPE